MQLSEEEREHIRLAEEYRAEVRAQLAGPPRGESLFDKLAVPVVILMATALISGLLVPWILGKVEDERRAFDLQSRLIEKIVGDDAAAQMNFWQYCDRAVEYQYGLLELELDKRISALRDVEPAERVARREELQQDFERTRTAYAEARAAFRNGANKYAIDQYGDIEWIKLHYGNKAPMEPYIAAAGGDRMAALREVKEVHAALATIADRTELALRACPDEAACEAIVDKASDEMDDLRSPPLQFKAWNQARGTLIRFISETRPRL